LSKTQNECAWVFALVLLSAGALNARSGSPDLLYSIEGTSVDYCAADQELAIARVHIKIILTNRNRTNAILSRVFYPRLGIKITDPSGATVYPTDQYELASGEIGRAPDSARFEIIKPGESARREFTVRVFVSRNSSHPVGSISAGGRYSISATLSCWPFYSDNSRSKQIRKQWRQFGMLAIADIYVKGLQVEVSVPPAMKPCGIDSAGRHTSACAYSGCIERVARR
jgi:hypothetical protein